MNKSKCNNDPFQIQLPNNQKYLKQRSHKNWEKQKNSKLKIQKGNWINRSKRNRNRSRNRETDLGEGKWRGVGDGRQRAKRECREKERERERDTKWQWLKMGLNIRSTRCNVDRWILWFWIIEKRNASLGIGWWCVFGPILLINFSVFSHTFFFLLCHALIWDFSLLTLFHLNSIFLFLSNLNSLSCPFPTSQFYVFIPIRYWIKWMKDVGYSISKFMCMKIKIIKRGLYLSI